MAIGYIFHKKKNRLIWFLLYYYGSPCRNVIGYHFVHLFRVNENKKNTGPLSLLTVATMKIIERSHISCCKMHINEWHSAKVQLEMIYLSSHAWISSTDSKVRITLYSIINNTTGKECSVAFIWMVTPLDFTHRFKSLNHLTQHNEQYHRKLLLSSFEFTNGHTIGLRTQTRNLELHFYPV